MIASALMITCKYIYFIFFSIPGVLITVLLTYRLMIGVVSISSANAGLISRQVIGNTYEGRPMHFWR